MSKTAHNTGGNHVALFAAINDGTGEAITVAAAATPQAIKSATLFNEVINTSNGGITWDGTTGVATLEDASCAGVYEVQALTGDAIGTNSIVADIEVWASEGGAAAAQVGIGSRRTGLATEAREAQAPAVAFVELSDVGDTVEARLRVGTNGHAMTFRDFALKLVKIGEIA